MRALCRVGSYATRRKVQILIRALRLWARKLEAEQSLTNDPEMVGEVDRRYHMYCQHDTVEPHLERTGLTFPEDKKSSQFAPNAVPRVENKAVFLRQKCLREDWHAGNTGRRKIPVRGKLPALYGSDSWTTQRVSLRWYVNCFPTASGILNAGELEEFGKILEQPEVDGTEMERLQILARSLKDQEDAHLAACGNNWTAVTRQLGN